MHFHHFLLRRLANFLNQVWVGGKLYESFSQNKNELILDTNKGALRIGCHTPLTFVIPQDEYSKAGKNVVNLFEELNGKQFLRARVVDWERILVLEWEDDYDLVLKMHGIQANVILRKNGEVLRIFNQSQQKDKQYQEVPGFYNAEMAEKIPASPDEFVMRDALKLVSPVFDKWFAKRVSTLVREGKTGVAAFQQCLKEAESETYYFVREQENLRLILFPMERAETFVKTSVYDALHFFLRCHYQWTGYKLTYRKAQTHILEPLRKLRGQYESQRKSIQQLAEERPADEIANILMANLHAMPEGQKQVELYDFYQEKNIQIKLDPLLSPQSNAAKYYSKHKERRAKLNYLKQEISNLEDKLLAAEEKAEALIGVLSPQDLPLTEQGFSLAEIKKLKNAVKEEEKIQAQGKVPFKTYFKDGWTIFVGRNAKNNDELVKFSGKDDLWFHAKDYRGSHVVIRNKAGKVVPKLIIEYAAGLAAWYSQRRNDSLVPVQCTEIKYLRKRKGDAPGKVIVSKEEVFMVEPVRGDVKP